MTENNTQETEKKERAFPIRLLTAYWPLDGRGRTEGNVELPRTEAMDLIKRGLAVRNDAL
mgnify:CR=1 FL=1